MKDIVVILPVYNGGNLLAQSVQSVLDQSLQQFDFYILDDCSTDESWQYLQNLKDDRIKLFRNEKNRGLFYNLNLLIRSSDAPLIKLWSQDDIMYPYCLERTLAFHRQYPQIGFSYSARDIIDEQGMLIQDSYVDKTPELVSSKLHARIAFYTGSIAGNIANVTLIRWTLDKVGLFREDMKISGDFDMWVRLAKDHPVGFIRQPLIQLRNHTGQLSRQEKYYVFHCKEDLEVYKNLLGYVNAEARTEGRWLLRNYKLLFYYTLMVKAMAKGKLATALSFYRLLSPFENMWLLTGNFIKNRILKINKRYSIFSDSERNIA